MTHAIEIVVNGWIYGVPLVLLVWAALRLLHATPARLRYVFVIVAFAVGIVAPIVVAFRQPVANVVSVAAVDQQGPRADALLNLADAMTLPFVLLWLIGAMVLLIRELAGHWRLHRARRSWEAAPAELRQLLAWPERFPLAVAPHTSPLTTGLARPLVVLPRDIAAAFPLPVARRIALHELSHCRWRDPLVYAAMRVAMSLFWISPLWVLLRWARREREVAADEVALRAIAGDEESYVAALVRLSRLALAHRLAASPMAASDLEFRAGRILAVTRRSSIVLSLIVFSGAAALASVVEPVRLPREPVVMVAAVPVAKESATPASTVPVVAVPQVVPSHPAREMVKPLEIAELAIQSERYDEADANADADDADVHVDVHVARDEHVTVDRHVAVDEHDAAEAVNEVIREAVQTEVVNHEASDARDDRNVIRIVSVIRTPGAARPSRWRSFVNAIRGNAREPAPKP